MKKTIILAAAVMFVPTLHAEVKYNKDPLKEFLTLQKKSEQHDKAHRDIAVLATLDAQQPVARVMHVMPAGDKGFLFNAHDKSSVSKQLASHSKAALTFVWHTGYKSYIQARISGDVEKLGTSKTRPVEKNLKEGFYQYLLKPTRISFSVTNKKDPAKVLYTHLDYQLDNGAWLSNITSAVQPKVKTKD